MSHTHYWETADELMTISLCSEGCVHLRVGRAVVKMTREEFVALTKLADKAAREMQFPESVLGQRPVTGH